MEKAKFLLAAFILALSVISVFAQEETQEYTNQTNMDVGPGMEVIKHGNVNVIVPKGAKVREEGGKLTIEDIGDYTGRKFEETDQRLAAIEETQQELREKIEQLTQAIADLGSGNFTAKR